MSLFANTQSTQLINIFFEKRESWVGFEFHWIGSDIDWTCILERYPLDQHSASWTVWSGSIHALLCLPLGDLFASSSSRKATSWQKPVLSILFLDYVNIFRSCTVLLFCLLCLSVYTLLWLEMHWGCSAVAFHLVVLCPCRFFATPM